MSKAKIQKFAVDGHKLLYNQIAQRAYQFGVEEHDHGDPNAVEVHGHILSALEKTQRTALIQEIEEHGYQQTIERVTYIWFNRIVALRFMEVNNYLPSHIRIFSDTSGAFKPEILNSPLQLEMKDLDKNQVGEYIENNQTEELYRYLILTQCAELREALPDIFVLKNCDLLKKCDREKDYTELLFPNNILNSDSFIARMLNEIEEDEWGAVKQEDDHVIQTIGWLYQYYNDERKNEVINIYKGTVKKEDIPAATQLFTTDWVVRYMVDNSLGRYWIERHPESKLAEKLEFLVTPKDGQISHIDEFVKPEDVKFLDPCMGSGHILVYAFDVLMEIYKESGYTERDAAAKIVQNNLFGLDIDDRASQLAYFAVMMKARNYDRRFLSRGIAPNVFAIQESNEMGPVVVDGLTTDEQMNEISRYLVEIFQDAKELGSILTVEPRDYDGYIAYLDNCGEEGQLDLNASEWLTKTRPMLKALAQQAKILSGKYPVVCTNPPYLNKMEGALKKTVTRDYKDYSGDLFSVFAYRNLMFCEQDGYCGYMTPFVWMFIKTYEKLREFIIQNKGITTLVQMEYSAFEEATVPICSFVLKNGKTDDNGLYFKLSEFKGGMEVQKQKVLEALENKDCGYFYEADQSNFSKIPGSPVAYWVSKGLLSAFATGKSLSDIALARNGMKTGENGRFVRLWWEIAFQGFNSTASDWKEASLSGAKWFPYNKGGEFRKWYGNNDCIVNWQNEGDEIFNHAKADKRNVQDYPLELKFKPSVSWSLVTSGQPAFRYKENNLSDIAGMSFFTQRQELLTLLGFCNSKIALEILKILAPTINFQAGDIGRLPIVDYGINTNTIQKLVASNIDESTTDWDFSEVSWDFKRHPLV